MNRLRTVTEKIPSPFGSLYAHVSHDARGRVVEVAFSSPGKHADTTIGDLLIGLATTANKIIGDVGGAK